MGHQDSTADEILARLAYGAHGVVTRERLLAAGITRKQITRRLQRGSLLREYRGVYRVGHRTPTLEARYLAAVYACGTEARLVGRATGHLYRLLKADAPAPEVAAPTYRRIDGITTRRHKIHPREATTYRGIPVTTVPRTLVDLAAVLTAEELARACHEADVLHGVRPEAVEVVLKRRPNAPGAAMLRAVLLGDVHVTLSKLERAFLKLLRAHGLPLPKTNIRVGARRIDCRWVTYKLTVELDSYRFHRTRYAWEQDRRREREARKRGDEFRRYTFGDVLEDPTDMIRELRELLLAAG